MKVLTSGVSHVAGIRLPDSGSRDFPKRWLETINDVGQWCS